MNADASPTILIVPGLREHVADHWQTYLEQKLANATCVPRMAADAPDKLSCAAWVDALDRSLAAIDGDVVLVGHSAGCAIIVHWAQRHARPVKGALLATPPDFETPLPAGYPTLQTLEQNGWTPIPRDPLPFRSIVAASTNDPLAQFACVEKLAADWGSSIVNIGPVGHLNPASGFGEWSRAETFVRDLCH